MAKSAVPSRRLDTVTRQHTRDRSREIVQANVWNEKPVSLTPDQLTLLQALDGRTTVTALVADLTSGGRDADAVIEDVRRLCERGVLDLV